MADPSGAIIEMLKGSGLLGPKTASAQENTQRVFGKSGIAGMANSTRQKAYKDYAEATIAAGDNPMPFAQWLAQEAPDEYAPRK